MTSHRLLAAPSAKYRQRTACSLRLCSAVALLLVPAMGFAAQRPQPTLRDHRIKSVAYDAGDVVELLGHYNYQTTIKFSPREKILTVTAGDSESWQITPNDARNLLFLKPLLPNKGTNLTIVTDKRLYSFALRAEEAASPNDTRITYIVEFLYPKEEQQQKRRAEEEKKRTAQKKAQLAARRNDAYSYAGSQLLAPLRVFDDGSFTYFSFADNTEIPAIFIVNPDGSEALANTHSEGGYIVVQRTARQFTLRSGDIATCIFDDTAPPVQNTFVKQRRAIPKSGSI